MSGGEKGPDARRRPTAAREAYPWYVECAAEGANEVDGPFSAPDYPRTSLQMDLAQPSEFRATAADWAGVSFCSIWTTLPFSIL